LEVEHEVAVDAVLRGAAPPANTTMSTSRIRRLRDAREQVVW
jgi:hypothetical protein